MVYLSFEDIVEVNKELGEQGTLVSSGNLSFIVAKQRNSEDIIAAAAVLLFGIITLHPFIEGNKRTAFNSAYILLRSNGLNMNASADDPRAARFLYEIAQNKVSEKDVYRWIFRMVK